MTCLFSRVGRYLTLDGAFYANINTPDTDDGSWQGLPVIHRPWGEYRTRAKRRGLVMEDLGPLSRHGHHSGQGAQDRQHIFRFRRP